MQMSKTHPTEIGEGDEITVTYKAASSRTEKNVSGTVTKVEDQFPSLDEQMYYVFFRTDDTDRQDFYNDENANRRVEWTLDEYDQLDGKNGGRWHRISTIAGVESVTL